jgi:hypothetical protein
MHVPTERLEFEKLLPGPAPDIERSPRWGIARDGDLALE